MLLGRKRPGQALKAMSVPGHQPSHLFYVTDHSTGLRFLVDTWAKVSVVPPSHAEQKHRQEGFSLQAINNMAAIPTFGNHSLTQDLGLRRTFRWVFIIAEVKNPILGADFLHCYNLLVDIRRNKLSNSLTHLEVQGITSQTSSPCPALLPRLPKTKYEAILSEFPSGTQPCHSDQPVKHDITHHITSTTHCQCTPQTTVTRATKNRSSRV